MSRSSVLLLFAAVGLAWCGTPFTMTVLGDRTGGALPGIFEQVLQETKTLKPDLVLNVGDLVEGYTKSRDTLEAEWDTIVKLLRNTGCSYRLVPGNHDIYDARSESVYTRRFGPTFYSFNFGGCHFVMLDNSRWDSAGAMPAGELVWLNQDLANARLMRWTMVFMHRYFWVNARRNGRSEPLHEAFKQNGVDYVFSGHDHYYCSTVWDSINYFQVGPSGSRLKTYDDDDRGAFQNYLLVTVSDQAVRVVVVKPGSIVPADNVTLNDLARLDTIDRQGLAMTTVDVSSGLALADSVGVLVRNVTPEVLETRSVWTRLGNWQVEPETVALAVTPQANRTNFFHLRLPADASPYPLPEYHLPYPYHLGREHSIERLLPIRRIADCPHVLAPRLDGKLDDPCWQDAALPGSGLSASFKRLARWAQGLLKKELRVKPLSGFGDKQGRPALTEPFTVWLGHDDTMLYVAVRCVESQMAMVKAEATERDGKVADDDNLNLLLCPNPDSTVYYQLIINPAGTIWDRKCRLESGKRKTDDNWNGDWRVATGQDKDGWVLEIGIPLRDFPDRAAAWGFNVCRFQARTEAVGSYQVPFIHDPKAFAILRVLKSTSP